VSYFEWSQNIQQFRWTVEKVHEELERAMRKAYADVAALARDNGLDLRTAAFVLAIRRVARAASSRRDVAHHLPRRMLE
jgi:glutamate dehydrogenase (NAD(P)+)